MNAEIITVTGEDYQKGTLLIEGSKIKAVGDSITIPDDVEIIDVKGSVLLPGLIDAHTHVGIGEEGLGWEGRDYNEMSDPITPELRAIDAINHEDQGFSDAREAGITTIMVGPGSANVIGGECTVLKTRAGTVDEMVLREKAGMKAALGENPKRVYTEKKRSPMTRMATAALLRGKLLQARTYMEKRGGGGEQVPDLDLGLMALEGVLRREGPLKAHAHRADDILTILRIAREFQIDVTLEHCTEGHKVAQEIASHSFPAVVGPLLTARVKVELRDRTFKTPGVLSKAGVKVALMTDHPVIPVQFLPLCAALAVRGGMDEREALKALTINGAEILGVGHRVGSLEVGKDADFLIISGDPLDLKSQVQQVYIDGEEVFSNK